MIPDQDDFDVVHEGAHDDVHDGVYLGTIQIVSILASPHHYRYHVPPAQGVEELLRDVVVAVTVLKCKVELVLLITTNITIRQWATASNNINLYVLPYCLDRILVLVLVTGLQTLA